MVLTLSLRLERLKGTPALVSVNPSTPPPLEGGGWGEGECINNPVEFHIFFTPTLTLPRQGGGNLGYLWMDTS